MGSISPAAEGLNATRLLQQACSKAPLLLGVGSPARGGRLLGVGLLYVRISFAPLPGAGERRAGAPPEAQTSPLGV